MATSIRRAAGKTSGVLYQNSTQVTVTGVGYTGVTSVRLIGLSGVYTIPASNVSATSFQFSLAGTSFSGDYGEFTLQVLRSATLVDTGRVVVAKKPDVRTHTGSLEFRPSVGPQNKTWVLYDPADYGGRRAKALSWTGVGSSQETGYTQRRGVVSHGLATFASFLFPSGAKQVAYGVDSQNGILPFWQRISTSRVFIGRQNFKGSFEGTLSVDGQGRVILTQSNAAYAVTTNAQFAIHFTVYFGHTLFGQICDRPQVSSFTPQIRAQAAIATSVQLGKTQTAAEVQVQATDNSFCLTLGFQNVAVFFQSFCTYVWGWDLGKQGAHGLSSPVQNGFLWHFPGDPDPQNQGQPIQGRINFESGGSIFFTAPQTALSMLFLDLDSQDFLIYTRRAKGTTSPNASVSFDTKCATHHQVFIVNEKTGQEPNFVSYSFQDGKGDGVGWRTGTDGQYQRQYSNFFGLRALGQDFQGTQNPSLGYCNDPDDTEYLTFDMQPHQSRFTVLGSEDVGVGIFALATTETRRYASTQTLGAKVAKPGQIQIFPLALRGSAQVQTFVYTPGALVLPQVALLGAGAGLAFTARPGALTLPQVSLAGASQTFANAYPGTLTLAQVALAGAALVRSSQYFPGTAQIGILNLIGNPGQDFYQDYPGALTLPPVGLLGQGVQSFFVPTSGRVLLPGLNLRGSTLAPSFDAFSGVLTLPQVGLQGGQTSGFFQVFPGAVGVGALVLQGSQGRDFFVAKSGDPGLWVGVLGLQGSASQDFWQAFGGEADGQPCVVAFFVGPCEVSAKVRSYGLRARVLGASFGLAASLFSFQTSIVTCDYQAKILCKHYSLGIGDLAPAIEFELYKNSKEKLNLTGFSDIRILWNLPGEERVRTGQVSITDVAKGQVKYEWAVGDTDAERTGEVTWQIQGQDNANKPWSTRLGSFRLRKRLTASP